MIPYRHALARLHPLLADAGPEVATVDVIARLEKGDREAIWALEGANEPGEAFVSLIQSCVDEAAGPEQFAEMMLGRCRQRFGERPGQTHALIDELQAVEDMRVFVEEFISAWRAYNASVDETERRDRATWVLDSKLRIAKASVAAQLRRAAQWLVVRPNEAERGRRATAFVYALCDDPSMFEDSTGRRCYARKEIAPAQGFTDRRMRDLLHDLAAHGIAAPGFEREDISEPFS